MSLVEISALFGNFGEFLGSLLVFGTLIYLARQVHHSRLATRADTLDRLQSGFTTANALPAGNPQIARIMRLLWTNKTDELDKDETMQLTMLFNLWANQWIKAAQAHKYGVITDNQLKGYASDAGMWFNTDFGQTQIDQPRYKMLVEYLRPYISTFDELNAEDFL